MVVWEGFLNGTMFAPWHYKGKNDKRLKTGKLLQEILRDCEMFLPILFFFSLYNRGVIFLSSGQRLLFWLLAIWCDIIIGNHPIQGISYKKFLAIVKCFCLSCFCFLYDRGGIFLSSGKSLLLWVLKNEQVLYCHNLCQPNTTWGNTQIFCNINIW